MNIAIIPARGGSKRIPHKNIKDFYGKPMIAWSIEAAQKSGCFDRIIVSTDDPNIIDVAQNYGAEVPFIRPDNLADDLTGTIPVIKHAIETLDVDSSAQSICCIYATAPFIQDSDIKDGFVQLDSNHNCSFAFSATRYTFPIQRAFKLNENNRVEMFQPDAFHKRSQDLEEAFHDAGQFYWGRKNAWLNDEILFSSKSIPVILPRFRVQDIDTMEDWEQAQLMFKALKETGKI